MTGCGACVLRKTVPLTCPGFAYPPRYAGERLGTVIADFIRSQPARR